MEPTKNNKKNHKSYTSKDYLWSQWAKQKGGVCCIPRHVLSGPDCKNLNHAAHRLLSMFAIQYNGKNNGDLCATRSFLAEYGFNSDDTISRSIAALLASGLIVKTRAGFAGPDGRRLCSLYGLTWLPIDEISDRIHGTWITKIAGTKAPLRTDFSTQYIGEIKYELNK